MNGRIKIFSKANMLDQYLKLALVLVITVFLTVLFNNTFIFGEMITRLPSVSPFMTSLLKIGFFAVLGIISYLALLPFKYGRDVWFYENAKKNRQSLKTLFSYYRVKKSGGAIKLIFLVQLKKFFITLLFLIPSIAIGGYIVYSLGQGIGEKLLFALVISFFLLTLTGLFFSFVFNQRYFLATFLYYENEGCRVKDVTNLSVRIMENKCFETAFLKLSFVPWMLLYVFLVPAVYVYPYYKLSVSFKAITLLTSA